MKRILQLTIALGTAFFLLSGMSYAQCSKAKACCKSKAKTAQSSTQQAETPATATAESTPATVTTVSQGATVPAGGRAATTSATEAPATKAKSCTKGKGKKCCAKKSTASAEAAPAGSPTPTAAIRQ